jgi:hypothetical protein
MAIVLQFNVILARKAEIEVKYPEGLTQFRNDWLLKPPDRWCEDEHLLAFSSRGTYCQRVLRKLLDCGIDVCSTSEAVPPEQLISKWDWIECDVQTRDSRADPPRGHRELRGPVLAQRNGTRTNCRLWTPQTRPVIDRVPLRKRSIPHAAESGREIIHTLLEANRRFSLSHTRTRRWRTENPET